MNIIIISLFPKELETAFLKGIFQKAFVQHKFDIKFLDLRAFATDKRLSVDDYPFGGGLGMLLKADVIYRAVTSIENYQDYRMIYPCPKGQALNQTKINEWSKESKGLILLCGYYEGVDERIFELLPFERVSIGEFVLSSGEWPALAITEAIVRQIPGVLGNPDSFSQDSIVSGFLENPQYTFPRTFLGKEVPAILLSGHHKMMSDWKKRKSLELTLFLKPNYLIHRPFSEKDQLIISDILKEDS
jgi:tRNA (guanine37-N1)-methyltransferase